MAALKPIVAAAAISIVLSGCVDAIPTGLVRANVAEPLASTEADARHLVVFASEAVPNDFAARVSTLGGSVEAIHDAIGVATVSGLSDVAVSGLASGIGVLAVERSVETSLAHGNVEAMDALEVTSAADATATQDVPTALTTAQFYARQWNMRAIFAPEAWAAGNRGSRDVVVAIIDTGIDYLHPDLVGLVDLTRSISLVPEDDPVIAAEFPGRLSISDLSFHGTAVASIVATNGVVLEGVNREVTLIAVKAFNRFARGPIDRPIAGIVYAADQGVDVINLSAGFNVNKHERPGTIAAMQRAVNYAFRKGAILIAPPGNDAKNLQHDPKTMRFPCELALVVCVSATGPTAAAGLTGPWENVDAIAPYSAFGGSAISVAAPGGAGLVGSGRRMWVICTGTPTEGSPPACRAGQPVAQPAATSFSAPHATGLAALLVSQLGRGNPALIRARLQQSADDRGDPGYDAFYGHGRINVARALRVLE